MNVILISVDLVETLEEARLKAYKAQYSTDLSSAIEEDDDNFKDKSKQKQLRNKSSNSSQFIPSPPAFKTSIIIY